MRLNIKYLDNNIEFKDNIINSIEIENKLFFYRLVKDLTVIANGNIVEDIVASDENFNEILLINKINIICDYFNFDFNSKKINSIINKKINDNITTVKKDELAKLYNKIKKIYLPILTDFDLNLSINQDFDLENIIKLLNIAINEKNNLLDNLFMIIDIEKVLNINKIIVFINLKQYLNKEELVEFYKYSVYNSVSILLIDALSHGTSIENEKKLIIDKDLEEFII